MTSTDDIARHVASYYDGDYRRYERAVGQVTITGVYLPPAPAPAPCRKSSNGLVSYRD